MRRLTPAAAAGLLLSPALAAVTVAPPVAPHALLQRGEPIPLHGTAQPGEPLKVSLGPEAASTEAGPDGQWRIFLPPLEAGGPYALTVQGASGTATVDDLLVGDLWLCAGQSNMELPVMKAADAEAELARASHPRLRLYDVPNAVAEAPRDIPEGTWAVCGPESVAHFSAVAYFFGREMEGALDVPVGLIDVSWGGTAIEAWMPRETLESDPDARPFLDAYARQAAALPQALADFQAKLPEAARAWEEACAAAKAEGKPLPPKPQPPTLDPRLLPAGIYNRKVAPLGGTPLRGVLWYQGESNTGRSWRYGALLRALIADWRRLWRRDELPFLIVQLPNYGDPPRPYFEPSRWAELRDAQAGAAALPRVSVVATLDLGEARNVHPLDKQDVGHRLAQAALHDFFGRAGAAVGPVVREVRFNGDGTATVSLDRAEGLHTRDGGPVTGFAAAGEDRKFVPVPGAVQDGRVVLDVSAVAGPRAVRHAWADNPVCNLVNGAGIPLGTYRSDDWPLPAQAKTTP